MLASRAGDLSAATTHYERALELFSEIDINSPRAQLAISDIEFQMGRLYIDRRDNTTALKWMQRCLERRQRLLAHDSPSASHRGSNHALQSYRCIDLARAVVDDGRGRIDCTTRLLSNSLN